MNLTAMRTELAARGFDYLSDTRKDYFLNRAYHQLCEMEPWPFLRTTTSGTAPLTISDLRQIVYVTDSTNDTELEGIDERTVRDGDPDLSSAGTPELWFLTGSGTLNVYPANTSHTISVVYYKVPSDLASGADAPIAPARYHYLIVDGAAILAYRDSDNFEASRALKEDWAIEVEDMSNSLLSRNYQNPDTIVGSSDGWYDG